MCWASSKENTSPMTPSPFHPGCNMSLLSGRRVKITGWGSQLSTRPSMLLFKFKSVFGSSYAADSCQPYWKGHWLHLNQNHWICWAQLYSKGEQTSFDQWDQFWVYFERWALILNLMTSRYLDNIIFMPISHNFWMQDDFVKVWCSWPLQEEGRRERYSILD